MPIYDYRCEKCEHDFTRIERISEHEKAKPKCPQCRSTRVVRVFSPVAVKTTKKS
jgi:putative FmdB family regulatory protein